MRFSDLLPTARTAFRNVSQMRVQQETNLLLNGRSLAESYKTKSISSLKEVEFKVFSQWGDDGIIQWLIHNLDIPQTTFMEFGVADYEESNTRFLLMNNNWAGFVMDSSPRNIKRIVAAEYFWKYNLQAILAFVDRDNINKLLLRSGFDKDVGILHIDLDGNDYWIWEAINVVQPVVAILEYNSIFGPSRAITVPYDPTFDRTDKHYSNLYFGASIAALCHLSNGKGYAFVGCNSAGNNAYFVRRDKLASSLRELTPTEGYVVSMARESRSISGALTYLSGTARAEAIRGLPVYNILTQADETF